MLRLPGLVVLLLMSDAWGSKLLLYPFPYYSHVEDMMHIARELSLRGHVIHLIIPPSLPQVDKYRSEENVTVLEYKVKDPDWYVIMTESEASAENMLDEVLSMTPIEDFRINTEGFAEFCHNALSDNNLVERVRRENYDLAIVDAFPLSRCHFILPYRLDIPYISLVAQYEPWLSRTPALPSAMPFQLHSPPLTPNMTLYERISNLVALLDWHLDMRISYLDTSVVSMYAPEKPTLSVDELASRSLLWLRTNADFVLDYPRPVLPNEVNIGGISTKPAKPLPDHYQVFMDGADNGVILASFGSFSLFPKRVLDVFREAFERLPYRVIWRYPKSPPPEIPSHIKLVDWLPQNDILGHPNMRLFVTHAGANSQYEAVYHGVPMLMFPVYGDQPSNAARVHYKGLGLHRSFTNVTVDSLVADITSLMADETVRQNIRKASAVFKDQPMSPKERAVHWVEHILKYGGEHLRSHAQDMPAYKYLMLDILTIAFVFVAIGLHLGVFVLKCLWRCLCVGARKEKYE